MAEQPSIQDVIKRLRSTAPAPAAGRTSVTAKDWGAHAERPSNMSTSRKGTDRSPLVELLRGGLNTVVPKQERSNTTDYRVGLGDHLFGTRPESMGMPHGPGRDQAERDEDFLASWNDDFAARKKGGGGENPSMPGGSVQQQYEQFMERNPDQYRNSLAKFLLSKGSAKNKGEKAPLAPLAPKK